MHSLLPLCPTANHLSFQAVELSPSPMRVVIPFLWHQRAEEALKLLFHQGKQRLRGFGGDEPHLRPWVSCLLFYSRFVSTHLPHL